MNHLLPRPTIITAVAGALTLASITGTAGFLIGRYPIIPFGIPVAFIRNEPAVFMVKSVAVVFMPLWTQLILLAVIGAVAVLLLYRAHGSSSAIEAGAHVHPEAIQDRDRMLHSAEAVSLLGMIWIAFQGITAWTVTELWLRPLGGITRLYSVGLITAVVLSVVVGGRAALKIGRPSTPHAGDQSMWRLKALYFNPADPALFVPARYGYGLTLNFGRPIAIALMVAILLLGLGGPFLLARSLLR